MAEKVPKAAPEPAGSREKIILGTMELLEHQGFHGTGLSAIVRESGAPKGSVYYHFPGGKEEIAAEAVKHASRWIVRSIEKALSGQPGSAKRLRAFVENIATHVESSGFRSGGPLMIVAAETATTNPALNLVCREAYARIQSTFEQWLIDGNFDREQSSALSLSITAAIEGGIIVSRTAHSGDALRAVAGHLELLLQTIKEKSR